VYYIDNNTRQFGERECPSITIDMTEDNNVIIITGSTTVNITRPAELTVYIGGLPSEYCLMLLICINQLYCFQRIKCLMTIFSRSLGLSSAAVVIVPQDFQAFYLFKKLISIL